jgi:methylated-DNA-[protein]-cysteine S-methyltransferase
MAKANGAKSAGACTPDEKFVAYVLGELPASQRSELERHSRVCPECRLRLSSFRDAGFTLEGMFTRSPRRREIAPASRILSAILAQLPEQKLYYDVVAFSGFGHVISAVTERGLCFVSFRQTPDEEHLRQWVEADFTVVRSQEVLADVFKQLREYFDGRLTQFDIPVDLRFASDFTRKVLAETAKVKFGQVATYQDIARKIHRPAATRAVGNALGRNPVPIVVPCHRVVASGGGLGGFTGGLEYKRKLLRIEGIEVAGGDLFA